MAQALEHAGKGVSPCAGQGAGEGGPGSVQVRRQGVVTSVARVVDPRNVVGSGVGTVRFGGGQLVQQGVGLAVDGQRSTVVDRAEVDRGALGEGQVGRRQVVIGQADRADASRYVAHRDRGVDRQGRIGRQGQGSRRGRCYRPRYGQPAGGGLDC